MPATTLIEAIRQAMDEEMARDESVIVIGADVGPRGGMFGATKGLFQKYGAGRVIDSPLSTAATVGIGVGAALYGLHPICEIQSADFIYPALNQIVNEAAKIHYRSIGAWNVPLVIRSPYGGGMGGGLYHSQSVETFFSHIPGLKVVIPSTPFDAKGLLKSAICEPNPIIFLEPRTGYRAIEGEIPAGQYSVPLGTARITRHGSDLSILTYGMMQFFSLAAAEIVAQDGIEVEVVDLRTLYPVDKDCILNSVRKTNRALIIYEDNLTGGYGAEIAAILAEEAFSDLDAPVKRLAGPDIPAVPFSRSLQEWFMLDTGRIVEAIRELFNY